MHVQLRTVALPVQASSADQPRVSAEEYVRACDALYAAAASEWVVIYGDREHAANLSYLCGFDPRFEEALLVLGRDARRRRLCDRAHRRDDHDRGRAGACRP